jgi:malonyl-CoA O-methyltransferase
MTPSLSGKALLDAGCGTGRRLPFTGRARPRTVVGIDLVFEMIVRARDRQRELAMDPPRSTAALAVADLQALPCRDALFDVVWCRLSLGHVPVLEPAYAELARVAHTSASIIISDFHPAAAHAGHARSFRDQRGQRHSVEHYIHEAGEHVRAARAAGLTLTAHEECAVGPVVRRYYEDAGLIEQYAQQEGFPFVLVLGFRA